MSSFVFRGGRRALVTLVAVAGVLALSAGCSSSSSSSSSTSAAPAVSATPATSSAAPASSPAAPGSSPAAPGSSAPAAPAPSASPAPSVSYSPLPAAAGQLTGTQLESVLLPLSDFPAGFATPSGEPLTSGGSLTSGPATYNLATISCATFIEHLGTEGFGETAFVSGSAAAANEAYDQFIYQFATPSGASAFVTGIQALAGRCGSFTATANGSPGRFALKATPAASVAGHPTLELLQTGTLGSNKLVLDTLFCASGVDVFAAAGVGLNGDAVPAVPAKETIIDNLMKRQAAAAVLS